MSAPIAGFIGALVVALVVIIWIAYCMFFRERHKSELYQFDISDLREKNYKIAQEHEATIEKPVKKGITAGIFILPSRHKHNKGEDYDKRPDYPESPAPNLQPSADKLVEIFNDDVHDVADSDMHNDYKDGIFEIDSNSQYHSDV